MYTDAQSFQIKTVEIYLHCNRDVRYDDDDNIERLACVGICDVSVCVCMEVLHPYLLFKCPIILKNHNGKFTIRYDEKVIIST